MIMKRSEKISFRLEHRLNLQLEHVVTMTKRNRSEILREAIEREISRNLHLAAGAENDRKDIERAVTPTRSCQGFEGM
jgi:predicted DNA-binding protein